MAIDFPDAPTANQEFTVGDRTWTWTGTRWESVQIEAKTAYDLALENGFVGTEAQWLASLVGPDGADGQDGQPYGNIDGGKANSSYGGATTLIQGGNAGSF